MILNVEIGKYTVNIYTGQLNHRNNKWYYVMQIEEFSGDGAWIGNKSFYIEGYKDGDWREQCNYDKWIREFVADLKEKDVTDIFKYKEHYHFYLTPPSKVKLI